MHINCYNHAVILRCAGRHTVDGYETDHLVSSPRQTVVSPIARRLAWIKTGNNNHHTISAIKLGLNPYESLATIGSRSEYTHVCPNRPQ